MQIELKYILIHIEQAFIQCGLFYSHIHVHTAKRMYPQHTPDCSLSDRILMHPQYALDPFTSAVTAVCLASDHPRLILIPGLNGASEALAGETFR